MKRKIIITSDGSKTIQIEEWNEQYHSKHGAIQEAKHVFLKYGLHYCLGADSIETPLSILEIGFGTGLNAFLTLIESEKLNIEIKYTGIEAFPVSHDEIIQLNYPDMVAPKKQKLFDDLHNVSWEKLHKIDKNFSIMKCQQDFFNITNKNEFDLIYFDAFGARVQPELWTETIFDKMFKVLKNKGVLVTYSAKGSVRRAMQVVGFEVEKLEGPPGKREMLRAYKKA